MHNYPLRRIVMGQVQKAWTSGVPEKNLKERKAAALMPSMLPERYR